MTDTTEPTPIEYSAIMRAHAKRMKHDPRDEPEVNRAIDRLRSRVLMNPEKTAVVVLAKDGSRMGGVDPLRALAEEMIADLEEATGPTDEAVIAAKVSDGSYRL